MSLDGNPLKILIVSQSFYPREKSNFGIKEAAEELAKKGHKVTVVARKGVNDLDVQNTDLTMHYINQEDFVNSGEWAYVFHNISFMWNVIQLGGRLENNFDIVVATIPTGFGAIGAKMLAKKSPKAKFCVDIKEPWVESAVKAGYIKNGSPIFKAAKVVESWVINKAETYKLEPTPKLAAPQ